MSSTNGYGAAEPGGNRNNTRQTNHVSHDASDEEQPLLNGVGTRRRNSKSLTSRLRKAAGAEVKRDWADVVLIFCYIITGMLDSSAISDWGSFVSMQTGKQATKHKTESLHPSQTPLHARLN